MYGRALRKCTRLVGHGRTTSSVQLDAAGQRLFGERWAGCVPSDRVPPRRPDTFLISNLLASDTGGSHWVCRYVSPDGESAWYDPLAQLGQAQRRRAGFERHVRQWTDETPAPHDQEAAEDNCGQRCLAALCTADWGGMEAFLQL